MTRLPGVGPRRAEDLARLGAARAGELLTVWPRRYQDRTRLVPMAFLPIGETAIVRGRVLSVMPRTVPGRDVMAQLRITDDTAVMEVVFFHARFLLRRFHPGQELILTGKVARRGRYLTMAHPEWEEVEDGDVLEIVPVYPLAGDLKQAFMRQVMRAVIPGLAAQVSDPMPPAVLAERGLPGRSWSLRTIHLPPSMEEQEQARSRLVLDEVLTVALAIQWLRARERGPGVGRALITDGELVRRFTAALPFEMTSFQRTAWDEVAADLSRAAPMARLLQGDVGSGKTVIAALACLAAVESGLQAAFMAPTEVLADQQARVFQNWFEPLGVPVASLTGGSGEGVRSELAAGGIGVVVGTHALIQDSVAFDNLGVVVVDEQHRFGVRQRSGLTAKGHAPHLLVMTATPIPRTLALTVYGDLNLTMIGGLPPGRRPVETVRRTRADRRAVYQEVMAAVKRGEQAYVVCPHVEEGDEGGVRAATTLYEGMRTLPGWRVGLVHGRLASDEKGRVMEAFRQHELDVLVATTIIEVGVDVPNATVMVIEDADRFGLAQLHQLRGRVGRGTRLGRCILVADPGTDEAEERLAALQEHHDGLRLAEIDLEMRGPGEVLGLRQHGLQGFSLANPLKDLALLQDARNLARQILDRDPELKRPEHQGLRDAVVSALGAALPASLLH
ncbi:MAG: ATP-dependent DNA helicase RecG [Clostridia bacterium]